VPGNGINKNLVDEIIPLLYDFTGWWSKLELFRPDILKNSQILYLDLDTLIVDDITEFGEYGGKFLTLRDFNTLTSISSGIMSFDSDETDHIFFKFIEGLKNGYLNLKNFIGGDQQLIEKLIELPVDWVQDLFPHKMAAFKHQCYDAKQKVMSIPEKTSIVCFHGKPKMGDMLEDPMIKLHWI
jgi:hypothetical protein